MYIPGVWLLFLNFTNVVIRTKLNVSAFSALIVFVFDALKLSYPLRKEFCSGNSKGTGSLFQNMELSYFVILDQLTWKGQV